MLHRSRWMGWSLLALGVVFAGTEFRARWQLANPSQTPTPSSTPEATPAAIPGAISASTPKAASAAIPASTSGATSAATQAPAPPKAPNPWFFLERAYPFGEIRRQDWQRAQLEARALKDGADPRAGVWVPRGPTNIGGRITDLAVHPSDAATLYAGAAEGGVLRSTNSGTSWTPLFDDQPSLSIGALALDPLDPTIVYAGTGEVNPGGGSVAYGGAGIFRSTNQGTSWEPLGLEGVGSIGRIRIDPTNNDRIYVAAMGDLWSKDEERGVYRSTDGGLSWDRVLFVSDSTGAVDLILRPDQPQTLFAALWERIRRPGHYQYGGTTCGVYRSTDGGDSWSLVAGGLPGSSSTRGRIGLSLCASQPQVMHAVYADRTGYFDGLYRSTNGGISWIQTNDGALDGVFASYGWWFGNVRTHPIDPNRIFVVGFSVSRSTNGGASWSDASGSMHVDHHAMEFGPGASPVIYDGNDGGVYRSTNGGTAWSKLFDLPITQFYRVALDASNPNRLYGGAQDNGTVRTLTGSLSDWTEILGGDGFQPLVDPTNSNRVWAEYQYGSLNFSNNGGSSWTDATGGISFSDRFNWNTAVRLDPGNPSRLYYGTQRVYRSTNGTSWTAISPDLTGGSGGGSQGQVYGTLTTLAISPLDGNVLWAGSDDGHVHVSSNGGGAWSDVSGLLPDRWITSVRTDPLDRETAYVTISGFRWGEPLPHVFRTTNLGSSWTATAGNLPEAPANDLIVDPLNTNRLFVATDVGVYETWDGGQIWGVLGSNLPNVVVTQLALDPVARNLVAATYGRSFFGYALDQPSSLSLAERSSAPAGRMFEPYPNPSARGAWIAWEANRAARVRIEVFSISGRRVWTESLDARSVGRDRIFWDGRDISGRRCPAGVYHARVLVDGEELGHHALVVPG